jgi:YHS domain-containing protein
VFRAILYLIVIVLGISVFRSIVGVISKGFADLVNPTPPSEPRTRTDRVPSVEALHKDPVCGTYIAPSTAVVQMVGGEKVYFCSTACRDKFSSGQAASRHA